MAHYSFLRDLQDSKVAVSLIADMYRSLGFNVEELGRDKQEFGDLQIGPLYHEVKYDIMAGTTNNLCFEIANGKGDLTGIAKTKADLVHYVVPDKDRKSFLVFTFDTAKLREYIFNPLNKDKLRHVMGGDRRKYSMIIVPISTIINDEVARSVEVVNA